MSVLDIRNWLKSLSLDQYATAFVENDIDETLLAELTEADLEKIGVTSLGHRKKLLKAIAHQLGSSSAEQGRVAQQPAPATYTPKHLADRILGVRGALEGERKQVTVLFADLKGSTTLIEDLDPEEAGVRLDMPIAQMLDAVHRFEGTVNRVQGDGIMALFGAPISHEDHALRACYAALAMQRSLATHAEETRRAAGYELRARVGLHSGEVVVRGIDNDLGIDYDAVGTTVHLAARMEQLASPGTIRLTQDTLRLAEGFIHVEPLGPIPVKGVSEPVEAFELGGVTAARTRPQAAAGSGLSHFVGRVEEFAALRHALSGATNSEGQVVAAVGEAGVGKSRLFHEFTRSPETHGWHIFSGSSVSYGKATPWLPVIELLRAFFRIESGDDDRVIQEKVAGKILTLDAALKVIIPALLSLLNVTAGDEKWTALDPRQRRRLVLDGIRALLLRESSVEPLVLVFEDLHWADDDTIALLDTLVESIPTSRILLLVNYRPEFEHGWGSKTCYSQLRIDPLGAESAWDLLNKLLGSDTSVEELKHKLTALAEGNPLFLEESVRSLVESGAFSGQAGAYVLVQAPDSVTIPASVQSIIAARIDRLVPNCKQLLQAAAVVGHDVPFPLLRAIAGLPEDELHDALAGLKAAEFLYEVRLFPELELQFKHNFTHEVAYGSLLRQHRRDLHKKVAKVIESDADQPSQHPETLAKHFEYGEIWDKAIEYYLLAADKLQDQFAYAEASDACRSALNCVQDSSEMTEAKCRALTKLGDLNSHIGDMEEANRCYQEALADASDQATQLSIENRVHHQHFATRGGARIAYYVHGSGKETIVLIRPGSVGYNVAIDQPMIERLCQNYRLISFDPRGVGASDPPSIPYLADDRMEDVRAIIETLDTQSVVGLGVSWGGNTLLSLAAHYPNLIKMCLCLGMPLDDMHPGSLFPDPWHFARRIEEASDQEEVQAIARFLMDSVLSEPETRDLADTLFEQNRELTREEWIDFFKPDPGRDITALLDKVTHPTLVMHGTEDQSCPFACATYIADRIPGAKLYAFQGKGHLPIFTATAEFCDVVRQFIETGKVPESTS